MPDFKYLYFISLVLILLPLTSSESKTPFVAEQSTRPELPRSSISFRGKQVHLKGSNIAWFKFARDFGYGLDEKKLRGSLKQLQAIGANSVRWWLHTDGSFTPKWGEVNKEVLVVGPGKQTIKDMRKALEIAREYDIYIIFCLWSFDMLFDNAHRKTPTKDNYRLLAEDKILNSYIDNSLIPMVKALNDHPQLFAWELFNEAENMTERWFVKKKAFYGGPVPSLERLQRVQALMAAAIHRTAKKQNQKALVTTGSKSMGKYNSDEFGGFNWYRDDRMIKAANGDEDATLDFYAPHYYNNERKDGYWSPYHRHVSEWGVSKPVVIGEFFVENLISSSLPLVKAKDLCRALQKNAYAGFWAWQWMEFPKVITQCLKELR